MRRLVRVLLLLAVLGAGILPSGLAQAQTAVPPAVCYNVPAATGSGATWRICVSSSVPPAGGLVVYAHGYVPFNVPDGTIPEDQLHLQDGTYLPDLMTALGFAFATTSYPQNGLAIVDGVGDIQALAPFARSFVQGLLPTGTPFGSRTYLTGVSEGGLVTVLASERDVANQFSGALAACGPIGSFQKQVNYLGDFRVLFDYFFAPTMNSPLYLHTSPVWIEQATQDRWSNYSQRISQAMAKDSAATANLIATSGAAVDLANPATNVDTTLGILWYNVWGTDDARFKLYDPASQPLPGPGNNSGNPYGNRSTVYRNPLWFGRVVPVTERFDEDPIAAGKLAMDYQTTGNVNKPLVTLHTTGDPIVPFSHETLYYQMALAQGKAGNVTPIPVFRYGHCKFTSAEVLGAFGILVAKVTGSQPALLKTQPFDLGRAQSDFARAQAESAKHPALR